MFQFLNYPMNYRVSRQIDAHLKGHYVCPHNAGGGDDVMVTSCRYDVIYVAPKNAPQSGLSWVNAPF